VRAAREQFDGWLTKRKESGIEEPAAYARGLEADYASFKAGLQLAWDSCGDRHVLLGSLRGVPRCATYRI
jgi:hypothetical protein